MTYTVQVEFHDRIGDGPPSYRWRCSLCAFKMPDPQTMNRITNPLDVDVRARVHLITVHAALPGQLESVIKDGDKIYGTDEFLGRAGQGDPGGSS